MRTGQAATLDQGQRRPLGHGQGPGLLFRSRNRPGKGGPYRKGYTHPEDFDFNDAKVFYFIFGVLMTASWVAFILSISGVF